VILISLDTLRADHLGSYGYPRPTSPSIDALAEQGVLFERAYSHAPRTAQSHMSLFTGLYPAEHGVENLEDRSARRLGEGITTLATILKRAGYRTRAFTGGGNVTGSLGFDQGFDVYDDTGGGATRIFARATDYLKTAAAHADAEERPFFLFVHTFEIHDPYVALDEYQRIFADPGYAGRIIGSPDELRKLVGGSWKDFAKFHRAYWARVDRSSAADVDQLEALYDASIRFTDEHLGRFLQTVRELGLDDRTVVVLLSDHGEEFGEHGGFLHESVYSECLHVPLVMRFPGDAVDPGTRVPEVVRLIDVMPTLLDHLQLPHPGHLQGASLWPLMAASEEPSRPLFAEYRRANMVTLVSGNWMLVQKPPTWKLFRWRVPAPWRGVHYELFDLSADPFQQSNLFGDRPDVVRAMRGQTDRLLADLRANGDRLDQPVDATIDEETLRQLESLGYIDR
jgi:arylsulfatase A-like enzyme